MNLPIVAYGSPILRKICEEIDENYEGLEKLLEDMWETLYNSNGVGLAAPQINKPIRLFLVDSEQILENLDEEDEGKYPDDKGYKGAFINAKIINLIGEEWKYNEGCLSIPKVREDISRHQSVEIEFLDENFQKQRMTFNGITARVILHEYDHIEGKLFIDYLKPLKRALIKRKLEDISKGKITMDYRMCYPK
jgi:peptide deformylase